MAKYQAIAATSNAICLMLENAALDSEWSDAKVELFQADKLQNPISPTKPRVSIYLYRVLLSTVRRDRGKRVGPDGRTYQPSLLVDLHYLITAWSQDAATAHRLLGWTFTMLQETPIIPTAVLNAYQTGVFEDHETVELVWNPLSQSDLSDLWQVASVQQAPSGTYVARAVRLDSTVPLDEGSPIQVRQFDYAGAIP
jgi:Pvc16 N-terminal domain